MQVNINGESQSFDQQLSISDLLDQLGLTGKRLAVEINEQIVPKSRHAETIIQQDDEIEIIHAIGGG